MLRFPLSLALAISLASRAVAQFDGLDREPINYATAKPDNAVEQLQAKLDKRLTKLKFTDDHGHLLSVLKELEIPLSSQMLVFSKTSLQRDRISPKTPRAIYFNDDAYVGFCLRGDVVELAVADPGLGTVFYTLDQKPNETQFRRRTDDCLNCHASSATRGVPGHLVRSVYADRLGHPILSAGSFRTDHSSPFAERWGGWYVTGTHGKQDHMGNRIVRDEKAVETEGNAEGQNVIELRSRFTVANYPSSHSDLVALMVFEHQVEGHNRIARAMIETRQAQHYETTMNASLGEPAGTKWDSATRRIETVADRLAEYLLFAGEAKLDGSVSGTSDFAKGFAARGPFDSKGRTLRQFDLSTRLFKYPCSYLVYSKVFQSLPAAAKDRVLKRMHDVLTGKDQSKEFAHLSTTDRTAVLEILRDTLPGLPACWKK